jgi:hypothetical protein
MTGPRGAIRERDAHGRLQIAGYEWSQRTIWPLLYGLFMVVLAALALLALNAAVRSPAIESTLALLVLAAALAFWAYRIRRRWKHYHNMRAMLFHADGRIQVPYGFAYHRKPGFLTERRLPDIASIAAEGTDVVVYYRSGDKDIIGTFPNRESEHKISVQLQLALTEMRDAIAQAARPQPQPVDTVDIVIE